MSELPDSTRGADKERPCPVCRMPISALATRCRYCGEAVARPREEARNFTVKDLGGQSKSIYVPSQNVTDAINAFRAEAMGQAAPGGDDGLQRDIAGEYLSFASRGTAPQSKPRPLWRRCGAVMLLLALLGGGYYGVRTWLDADTRQRVLAAARNTPHLGAGLGAFALCAAWIWTLRFALRRARAPLKARLARLERSEQEVHGAYDELLGALGGMPTGTPASDQGATAKESAPREDDGRARAMDRLVKLNELKEVLLAGGNLEEKLRTIAESLAKLFDADFCRIWLTKPGDLCEQGCVHALDVDGPHTCRSRKFCLHLMASAGRHGRTESKMHQRVPFGCYKIGRVGAGLEKKFLTNDVAKDPRVANPQWADQLGLVSFAGYRLASASGDPIGVFAFFAKHPISPEEDALLESMAGSVSQAVQTAQAEEELEKLVLELQEALANIKTLRGLLPICASCKKIRQDDGYWSQIESYVRDHSHAEFTHSICPECKKKLYPELYQ